MEPIKNILILVLTTLVISAHAQNSLTDAFKESYALEKTANYTEAIVVLKKHYSPQNYEINLRLGWLYYLSEQHQESVTHYQKASSLMPASVEALWGLINPLSKLEKWQEVERTYLKIADIDSQNSIAHYRLGLIYYYRKDYVKAKKYFDVSLNQYPFDYDSNLMSAWTAYYLGNMNQAKVLFQRVLLIQPDDASALEGLSLIKV